MLILLSLILECSRTYSTTFLAKSWEVPVSKSEVICINSSLPRTIFVFGSSPTDITYSFLEKGLLSPFSDSISHNSIIFAINYPSSISFQSNFSGNVTISTVSLGERGCLDGVFVTNEINHFYTNPTIPLRHANERCFYHAMYGTQKAAISANVSPYDTADFICNEATKKIDFNRNKTILQQNKNMNVDKSNDRSKNKNEAENLENIECEAKNTPLFVRINTSAWEIERKVDINFTGEGSRPYAPMSIERLMTPRPPLSKPGRNSKLGMALMVATMIIVFGVLAFLGVILFIKFFRKARNNNNNEDDKQSINDRRENSMEKGLISSNFESNA